jgi:hypothetical protein
LHLHLHVVEGRLEGSLEGRLEGRLTKEGIE